MSKNKTYKIEKIPDCALEIVSGGLTCKQTAMIINVGVYTALGTGLGAISCCAASAICSSKASSAVREGDADKNLQYSNAAKYLSIAGASLGAVGIAAATVNVAVSITHGKNCTKCCIGKPPKSNG